jgi:redox-sensing transcriptional repressor
MSDSTGRPGTPRPQIPEATVGRLPLYHRALVALESVGETTVSSEQLAEMAGVNAAKVRKDLSYFGSYGTRGVGYDVEALLAEIRSDLGLTSDWKCVVVGAGNLGSALISFAGFRERGFHVVAAVDIDPNKVGTRVGDVVVAPQSQLPSIVRELGIGIGVVATVPAAAQEVVDVLAAAGVRSVLNFAPTVIEAPADVLVRNVDLASELEILAFHDQRRNAVDEELTAG